MPLIATRGAASAQGFGEFAQSAAPVYIEEVFQTWLYDGTSATQTITNGIDLSTKGGLVWIKNRNGTYFNTLFDTVRGTSQALYTNTTDAQTGTSGVTAFNTTGFTLGAGANTNAAGYTFASWTFREQPKFFDVVTFSGTGSVQNISHNLGAVPACMIIKDTTNAGSAWAIYHTSLGNTQYLQFTTAAAATSSGYWNNTSPTSTQFTVGTNGNVNQSGATYVAYLFAHNAGGFGLTGTDNVISCGSFTTNGSGNATVSLGYEPQWVLVKGTGSGFGWSLFDNMRGMPVTGDSRELLANSSSAEGGIGSSYFNPTATGFYMGAFSANQAYIYIAIRRGPMKVPTSGTSVYQANTYTGNGTANTTVAGNFGFPVDLLSLSSRSATALDWVNYAHFMIDRLRGQNVTLSTASTNSDVTGWQTYNAFDVQNSIGWGLYGAASSSGYMNNSGGTFIARGFRRAPSFFDEVCYTGTGVAGQTFNHNLTVVPELMIVKCRSSATPGTRAAHWEVYSATAGAANFGVLNLNINWETFNGIWNSTAPTSSVFTVGSWGAVNASGETYVAYLFASAPNVSKVGSYTGTEALQTINCGFTSGARFVLIRRYGTSSGDGDWYVWDSARGITSGNDPYLLLNSTAAEVTGTNYVDTDSTGFKVTAAAPAGLNASGGTYIFLAIA